MKSSVLTLASILTLAFATRAISCDLCGCYTPQLEVVHERSFGFYAGAAEQFTHFGTERLDGVKQPNPAGEYINSSVTQFVIGATFLDNRVGLQLNLPLIYRSYQRQLGFDIDKGHVSGLGDLSLLANWIVFKHESHANDEPLAKDGKASKEAVGQVPDFSAMINLIAGVKLPTGDTSRLKENFAPEVDGAPDSGIGPHDLTLGTGSVDGIFGMQAALRYKSVFFEADVHYTVRGPGAYQYRFANDLAWSGGPGVYLFNHDGRSLALQCVVAGETKGYDHFQGVPDPDSGVTALTIGPKIIASFGRVSGDVALDLPVITNATAFQTTADYRIRAGFTIRF